jgi:anti-sigma factor RsiW
MANAESRNPGQPQNDLAARVGHSVADELRLFEYLDRRLPGREAREVEVHLLQCGECQALRQAWQRLDTQLAEGLRRPALSPDFTARLTQRLGPVPAADPELSLARQKAQAEKELQETWFRFRRRFLRVNLPVLADGLGYAALAAVAGYYLGTFGVKALAMTAGGAPGLGQHLGMYLASVVSLMVGLAGLGFAGRKQLERLWAAL